MNDRGSASRRAGSGARARNSSRSATSSARSSAAFERDHDQHLHALNQPYSNRYNPSLRSVGSRVSLSDQFATTRREYEFGFDDGASFITTDAEAETDQDDTLTGAGSFDGVIVTPPASYRGAGSVPQKPGQEGVRRSHYELLSLPPGDEASEGDIRRAYFRLSDILRSDSIPAQHQDLADRYLGHAQAAFETLSSQHSRIDYDESLQDDELVESTLLSGEEGDDDVDGDMRQARRTNPRLVQELRRQQERESTEVRLHLDAQSIVTPSHRQVGPQRGSPTTLSLTQTSVTSLPAISQLLQPRLRQIRTALSGATPAAPANHSRGELYCTTPTVTVTSSIFATDVRDSYLPPASASGRQQNLSPDTFPKDRQLQWYTFYFAPALNFKLRQELFVREAGLSEAALRRTLPDAVLEIETDAVNAASLTARASHVLRLDGDGGGGYRPAEPLHTEASVSVSRSWPAARYRPRFGLGLHRRVGGQKGGAVFACADSGTPSLWDSLSPSSFLNQSVRKRLDGDSTGASWRSYMDQLSQLPSYYSPPTLEVGYKFGGFSEDTLGLRSGRAFTKPAGSGLRRLHDSVALSGPGKGGSWTVSGALTTGGVAGYLRFGRNLLSSPTELEHSVIPSRLRGLRFEAELSTYKSRPTNLLGRVHSLGRSEITQLAVRGLRKFGKSSKLGLEVSVNNSSSSVVLSLYYSTKNNRSLTVPLVLFRDQPSPHQFLTRVLLLAGFLPALALAALDHARAFLPQADAASPEEKGRRSRDVQKYIAERRAEADDLIAVLGEPVSQRQRVQRERGGLVVLSAKYGVLRDERPHAAPGPPEQQHPAGGPAAAAAINLGPSWASPEEVADVTVALAALVDDDGTLSVPEGLRKSRLLGFWDPRPRRTKCLSVRYMFRGQERVKEVMGRDELVLP